jgi:hypothetical protein
MAIEPKLAELQTKAAPFHRDRLTFGDLIVENAGVGTQHDDHARGDGGWCAVGWSGDLGGSRICLRRGCGHIGLSVLAATRGGQLFKPLRGGLRRLCPFRKLYPDVMMVEPGQDRDGNNGTGSLNCPAQRRVFA